MKWSVSVVVGALAFVLAFTVTMRAAWAQTGPSGAVTPPTQEQVEEARRHYERGVTLFNEGNYEAAFVEMERAYSIAPSYRIHYNLGLIHRQLNHYAEAIRSFEMYLQGGGANVPADRREEIEKELALLKTRVATIEVRVNVPGADIYIDDAPVGKAPLPRSIVVDPGRRKVSAAKPGYAPAVQVVTVVGTDAEVVRLSLVDLSKPAERRYDPGPRNRAFVAWGVTGALTVTAVVFGVLTLGEESKLNEERDKFGADFGVVDKQASKVKTFALVTDITAASAVLGGAIATYFTIKAAKSDSSSSAASAAASRGVKLDVGLGYLGLHGSL